VYRHGCVLIVAGEGVGVHDQQMSHRTSLAARVAAARVVPVLLAVALLTLSGCGSPDTPPAPATAVASAVPVAADPQPSKVLVVVEENHTAASALHEMPYPAALAGDYGQTTDYRAVAHPSLPNYLALAGGRLSGSPTTQTRPVTPSPGTVFSIVRSPPGEPPRPTPRPCPHRVP